MQRSCAENQGGGGIKMYFAQYIIFLCCPLDWKAAGFALSFAMFANNRNVLTQRGLNGL